MTIRNKSQLGVSLIELNIALLLAGVLVVMGIGDLSGVLARAQGRSTATEIAAELRSARSDAALWRQRVRVLFDQAQGTIRTETADPPVALLREYRCRERGVEIESISNSTAVIFYATGRVASPTTITLRNRRGDRWRLTVTLTGRVTVS